MFMEYEASVIVIVVLSLRMLNISYFFEAEDLLLGFF